MGDLTERTGPPLPITIDLTRLENLSGPEAGMLTRYLTMIQVQRQDFNGKVLTIRAHDVAMLAMLLDIEDSELLAQLDSKATLD